MSALVKTAHVWQLSTVLMNASSSNPKRPASGDVFGCMRARSEGTHSGTTSLAMWSDAAYGGRSAAGKCRLGHEMGITSPTLSGPRPILRWPSKSTRELERSSSGGDVYALSEAAGHVSLLEEFYSPVNDLPLGPVSLDDCESLLDHLENKMARRKIPC